MSTAFKILGMLLLFSSCAGYGFFRAYALQRRHKRLEDMCKGMEELYSRILHSSGEIDRLMRKSFGDTGENLLLQEQNAGVLNAEDMKLLVEFLSHLGSADTQSECARIRLYKGLFEAQRDSARDICIGGCRLWRTAGVCTGLAGCIFLL